MKHQIIRGKVKLWMIMLAAATTAGCNQTSEPPASTLSTFPFPILPRGTTITGGEFYTISGSFEGFVVKDQATAEVGLSYHDWPGTISVKLDGMSVKDYITDVATPGTPYTAHTWEIDSNGNGIPSIVHSIRALSNLEITSPAWHDTISNSAFNVRWTPSQDTTSHILIFFTPTTTPQADSLWTSSGYLAYAADNGSYVFPDSVFAGVPKGYLIDVQLLRYVYDCDTISGKNYLFLNAFQRSGEYILR